MTPNEFLNAIAADNKEMAQSAFETLIQDRVTDALEVRKVELASSIFGVQEEEVNEGAGSTAQRQWVRQVASVGKYYADHPRSTNRTGLKADARKVLRKWGDDRAYMQSAADLVKGARRSLRKSTGHTLNKEETINELTPDILYRASEKSKKREQLASLADLPNAAAFERERSDKFLEKGMEKTKALVRAAQKGKKSKFARYAQHDMSTEEAIVEGGPTRKHFQQVADLIKNVEHPDKRKELAQHHAGIFKQQNPRFDRAKFMSAAGVTESVDEAAQAAEKAAQPSARNVITNIRRGIAALKLKGVNPAVASRAHADYSRLVAKNPKAPGYMLLRKLSPNKAQAMQALTQSGMPVGGALDADPMQYNQALQRVKRFN